MHPDLEKNIELKFQEMIKKAESLLGQLAIDAKAHYGDNLDKYYDWLNKASMIKAMKPSVPNEMLKPMFMDMPKEELYKLRFGTKSQNETK